MAKKEIMLQAGFIDGVPVCPCCGNSAVNSFTVDVDSYVNNNNNNDKLLRFIKRCDKCRKEYYIFKTMITLIDSGKYVLVNEEDYTKK